MHWEANVWIEMLEQEGPLAAGLPSVRSPRVDIALTPLGYRPDVSGAILNDCTADAFDRALLDLPPATGDLGSVSITGYLRAPASILPITTCASLPDPAQPARTGYACDLPAMIGAGEHFFDLSAPPMSRRIEVRATGGPSHGEFALTGAQAVVIPTSGIEVLAPRLDGDFGESGVIDVTQPAGVELTIRCPDRAGASQGCGPIVAVSLEATDGQMPPQSWATVTCRDVNPATDGFTGEAHVRVPYTKGAGTATRPVLQVFERFPWRVLRTSVTHLGAPDQAVAGLTAVVGVGRHGFVTRP